MGDAKRRKLEISTLKESRPEGAKEQRQRKADEALVGAGIDPKTEEPQQTISLARTLKARFDEAKSAKKIDGPVLYLLEKVQASNVGISDVQIACKKGCSYCCNLWVNVSAPEALHVANIVRRRGNAWIARVHAADAHTGRYSLDERFLNRHPCPLLEDDNCSIYEDRPQPCRFAASTDAVACARSHLNSTDEIIPIPEVYLRGQIKYGYALAAALRACELPYHLYEFNSALSRALSIEDAEMRWLAGEDIFADVLRQEGDIFAAREAEFVYRAAFSGGS
jgi:hypothetical protein